jgi:predicted unusual protein kinase regulating ubiquinone biosynthesis (AarF/ABC1/UbiB family)
VGTRLDRAKRALFVGRVARRGGVLRVLRELGVWGSKPATEEGAREFREALQELGTTYIKLGQLLSSRPDLLPDEYIADADPHRGNVLLTTEDAFDRDLMDVGPEELPRELLRPLGRKSVVGFDLATMRPKSTSTRRPTHAAISRCCFSRWRRTAPTTWPI